MTKGKHRKEPTAWFTWKTWLASIIALGIMLVACAAGAPAASQAQAPVRPDEWKPMSVPDLEYACDPVLGVIVKRQWHQNGMGSTSDYENWTIDVVPYSQLDGHQRQQMCEYNR